MQLAERRAEVALMHHRDHHTRAQMLEDAGLDIEQIGDALVRRLIR